MEDAPFCVCGIPSKLRIVHKEGPTQGREFYGCSKWTPAGTGCGFFEWAPSNPATPNYASPPRTVGGGGTPPSANRTYGGSNINYGATPSPQSQTRYAPTTANRYNTASQRPYSQATGDLTPRALFSADDGGPVFITLERVDNNRVAARFRYNEKLKEFIKTFPYPSKPWWEQSIKAWTFSPRGYKEALRLIQRDSPVSVYITNLSEFDLGSPMDVGVPSVSKESSESASQEETLPTSSARKKQQQEQQRQAAEQVKKQESSRQQAVAAPPPSSSSPQPSFPVTPQSECSRRLRSIRAIWSKLYGFQREAVQFGLQRGGRVLLGDDMGLGKTVQALALAACYKDDWPLLIVSPSTMKLVWKEAVRAWLPPALQPAVEDLVVVKDGKSATDKIQALCVTNTSSQSSSQRPRIVIVSYDMVKRLLSPLCTLCPHVIIADESHHLKSLNAQRTQSMKTLADTARRVIFISGTPALSRPFELYPQVSMLRPGLFGTVDEFGMRYCDGKPALDFRFASSPSGMDYKGSSNTRELRSRLEKDILIRREKSSVLSELPEKIRKRIPIEIAPKSRGAIEAVKKELASLEKNLESGRLRPEVAEFERQRLVTELFRVTGPAKVPEAVLHIQSLIDAGQKVLVFAHHKEVLDALQRDLKFSHGGHGGCGGGEVIDLLDEVDDEQGAGPSKRRKKNSNQATPAKTKRNAASTAAAAAAAAVGRKRKTTSARTTTDPPPAGCVRIDGSVTELRRKAAVDAFQSDPAVRAALLSINAAGIGLTLTAATVVTFVELWWTPAALIQAEDRAHRLGQRGALEVQYLTAMDTADDLMWRTIQGKLGVVSSVVGGNAGGAGGASGSGSGSRITPKNLFRDIKYAKRYENVQQRLAEEAERGVIAGGAEDVEEGATAGGDDSSVPSISNASTVANPGANYAEVFEQQRQQESEEEGEESEEEESEEEYVPTRRWNARSRRLAAKRTL
ncbi:hypothetical protein Ndes2526B_g03642 [Nannochloris sp. 'desiccata']|nr:hypothetical protein KSW81_005489 [Chlorella desiccata (nom. nud.)]KAH7621302.1 putative SWI/SNF-related matrix-associated actin-dependent regulator of chromatin subfamily A-like protein 1 [Chlorella desiccata (nom. nud.)]